MKYSYILASLVLLSFTVYLKQSGHQAKRTVASESLEKFDQRNSPLLHWYDHKSLDLQKWLDRRGEEGGPPDFIDFYLPTKSLKTKASSEDMLVAAATKDLYDEYFPPSDPSSFVGTFFESGHPYVLTTRGPYQWNSLKAAGIDDLKQFEKTVKALRTQGFKSMRLGPNLHEVDLLDESSWDPFIDKIDVIWKSGGTPTISVAFFPSLKRWEVSDKSGQVDYARSYLLHPKWPEDMGKLTSGLMKHLWKRAADRKVNIVINGINEPETLAGFNRQFWHGAFAKWNDPQSMRYYVPSVIQIAKANVAIRQAVEASTDRRILFMHNEAMTPAYYPSHRGGGRFAVSKFMLGDPVLMTMNVDHLQSLSIEELKKFALQTPANEIQWALKEYAFGSWNPSHEMQQAAASDLLRQLGELKSSHLKFITDFKKTMRTDTMLLLDYYYQTEFIPNIEIDELVEKLSTQNGKELREVLGIRSDEAFLKVLQKAASSNESDLPAEGQKGSLIPFPYRSVAEINFKTFLKERDYVILERLIGLRREFTFSDDEPYASRQKKYSLRPLEETLYRLDSIENQIARDQKIQLDPSGLSQIRQYLGVKRNILIGFEPQHYPRQVRAGLRYGFYDFFMEYVRELKIYTAGVGESGTPFFTFAPLLHDQVMMEYAQALKNGVYGTQYAFGPAIHTRGWAKAPLGLHYEDDHEINPSGILSLESLERPSEKLWVKQFLGPLFEALQKAQ